ncbi:MAG: hypothetical protein VR64_22735 [Desulfatitalea sp. BRH_c12]|nr:MAG: hypothetical protein VR64_22735 [Desulfatitalea sp. BRH_c12]
MSYDESIHQETAKTGRLACAGMSESWWALSAGREDQIEQVTWALLPLAALTRAGCLRCCLNAG